ncbi:MAG: histidine kinase dimerization/phospho-acceptor domain-containing protein, partial [Pseudomonadota bacterium]
MLHACPSPSQIIDTTGRLVAVNAAWLALLTVEKDTGRAVSEGGDGAPSGADAVIGRAWHHLFAAKQKGRPAGPVPRPGGDLELCRGDGKVIPVLCINTACEIPSPDGWRAGLLCQFQDLLSLHAQILAINARENEANLVRSQFLSSMSHELRTPLNIVQGYGELLRDSSTDQTMREYLDTIIASAQKLATMLEDVLDLSKIEAGQVGIDHVDFDLASMIEELRLDWLTPARAKGIEFTCTFDPSLAPLGRSDPLRIKQVLTNYIANSVKFTEGGSIRLSARRVGTWPNGQVVRFEVEDTGMGVPEGVVDQLFQAFEKDEASDGSRQGWGLGLAIVRRLADMLGAEIGYERPAGGGALFFLELVIAA